MADGNQPSAIGNQGPAIDRYGESIVDPTRNVLDLVGAAIQRQDDLRNMQATHLAEMARLRSEHAKEMRRAESDRINAIRAVDVGAVAAAAQVSATAATTLAGQVAASADALRNQVAAAAAAQATSQLNALEPIQKSIDELRRAQYETAGSKTPDPAMVAIAEAIRQLQVLAAANQGGQSQRTTAADGQRQWTGIIAATILGIAAIIVTILLRG